MREPSERFPSVPVREGYDQWAPSYDALDNPLVAMTVAAMAEWRPSLDGARVVELGCGTGRNAEFFLAAGAREYVGVDGSRGMLRRARERVERSRRARWLEADLREPLPAEIVDFDLVFVSLVLEHVPDLLPIFASAAAATRPGGRFHAYELHAELHAAGTQAHFRGDDGAELYLPSYAHPASEYRTALDRAGWQVVRMTDWYATPHAARVSEKLRKHLGKPVLIEVSASR